jgi:hypothetical protein
MQQAATAGVTEHHLSLWHIHNLSLTYVLLKRITTYKTCTFNNTSAAQNTDHGVREPRPRHRKAQANTLKRLRAHPASGVCSRHEGLDTSMLY